MVGSERRRVRREEREGGGDERVGVNIWGGEGEGRGGERVEGWGRGEERWGEIGGKKEGGGEERGERRSE